MVVGFKKLNEIIAIKMTINKFGESDKSNKTTIVRNINNIQDVDNLVYNNKETFFTETINAKTLLCESLKINDEEACTQKSFELIKYPIIFYKEVYDLSQDKSQDFIAGSYNFWPEGSGYVATFNGGIKKLALHLNPTTAGAMIQISINKNLQEDKWIYTPTSKNTQVKLFDPRIEINEGDIINFYTILENSNVSYACIVCYLQHD